MHNTHQMKQPISKPPTAAGKDAEQISSAKKAASDSKSSAKLLPVFSKKPMRVIFAAILFLLLVTSVFFVANHYAKRTARGFPNFQDYQINLVNEANRPQTVANFANQPVALFFGFTYCPDICPTTLTTLTAALDDLQIAGVNTDSLRIVFVTVDPLRDTPEQVKQYLSLFDANVTGLTGTPENIRAVLKQFGIYTKKTDRGDGDYLYDHSAAVFLYRGDGQFKGTIVHSEPFAFIREKLKSIL
jgi:protein SCO1/2